MNQKAEFLESEGDAWFRRNRAALDSRRLPDDDPVLVEILDIAPPKGTRVLEIGCGDGSRLAWLQQHQSYECYGVDPSGEAVEAARSRGIDAQIATADRLPFGDGSFDLVVFGFCLYLCDREDLFQIAREADRVLAQSGWLVILDFYAPTPLRREYHHRPGLFSHKMDYRTMFAWHPAYTTVTQKVRDHSANRYTDDPGEWVAISVLRKHLALE